MATEYFAPYMSETKIEINRLLDGESLFRVLPALSGQESDEEILELLKSKIDPSYRRVYYEILKKSRAARLKGTQD